MKKRFLLLLALTGLVACGQNASSSVLSSSIDSSSAIASSVEAPKEVTVVYTNDIHGYIANEASNSSETGAGGLRISSIGGYVEHLKGQGKNVLLVDAGDEVQGSIYGALDHGVKMIEMMNEAGYDLATPGNHDFDFGMDGFNYFVEHAKFPYISCNFRRIPENTNVLDSYKVFDFGGLKVGFVGVSTPDTIVSSTPKFFQNDKGEFIYSFLGYENPNELYDMVQKAIDEIKDDVDYVIGLGHVGVGADNQKMGASSEQIIQNTTGFSAFIDGHSHTTMECQTVKDKAGKDCLLSQTGCYLSAFGELTLSKTHGVSMRLIKDTPFAKEDVKALERELIDEVAAEMGKKIATTDNELYICEPNDPSMRIIRNKETNLGDLCSDAMYWFLNENKKLDCDISLINGGGIRKEIDAGETTYLEVKSVHPFGNQICLIKTKGINVKNAIEMGARNIGEWDEARKRYAESGGFMHMAGLTYDIDVSIPSSVRLDDKGMFISVDGEYRAKNVKVYDKKTATYVPLDENKEYLVSGVNYTLKNGGDGFTMFNGSEGVVDFLAEDYVVLAEYMKAFDNAHVNNANCPLKGYQNYLYDYENPYGAGRINILNLA